ncbi:MAG: redoxin domain-containing protein [Proteobacteria bacterium]|nr:redoxin domain-containing protein [Pseudomonadota bacterium]
MLRAVALSLVLAATAACSAAEDKAADNDDPRAVYAAKYQDKILPNLKLADVNGDAADMVGADYDGKKPLIVNLWATWCTPCVKEMPSLYKLQQSGKAYVVAVTTDRMQDRITTFLSEHNLKDLNVRWDRGSKTLREAGFAVPALPVTFILTPAKDGGYMVRSTEMGEREWDHPTMWEKIVKVTGE